MSKIEVILVDDHHIVCEGIRSLLADSTSITVMGCVRNLSELLIKLRILPIHVILLNTYEPGDHDIDMIRIIQREHPQIKILIMAMTIQESFILRTLKAGAKGFLSKDADRNELVEAIMTVRNGYDYYSKSISNIILKRYLDQPGSSSAIRNHPTSCLSDRELEVLKLFAESYTNQEIADKLFVSIRTVESHKNNIMRKINLKTTVDMVKFAIRNNLIEV
ncbi:MAG: response regulator transcription factor [Lentimicrobiaceae bacterium]|nr:response regulator transcription factor [Lentimicrobiaceae bacterium]